tara:strand:+ start:1702 stop:1854 length:153 start_codon:yes stop_codon:yes gene_type:complete
MWFDGLPIYVLAGLVALELLFYAFFGATVWRIVGRRRLKWSRTNTPKRRR